MGHGRCWSLVLGIALLAQGTFGTRACAQPSTDPHVSRLALGLPLESAVSEWSFAPPAAEEETGGRTRASRGSLLAAAAEADPKPERGRSMTRRRLSGPANVLGGERARILLQSLTMPGWGQASLGRKRSATVFAIAETGVWASFAAFRIQSQLRRLTYERTAQLFAGIDLHGRSEEFRRIIGLYPSSDYYNLYVVRRDAANLFFKEDENGQVILVDPEGYRQYILANELHGSDIWAWDSEESFERYRKERKATQRAGLRANAALAMAVANRLVSAIHAARYAGHPAPAPRSWNLECVPVGSDPTAFHLGVRARF